MPIPSYEQAMMPVLRTLAKASPRPRRDISTAIADEFGLSDHERAQLLPSGKVTVIVSRVGWALSYMKQAGLVVTPKRGVYEITDRGKQVVAEGHPGIDAKYLERFPEFKAFMTRSTQPAPAGEEASGPQTGSTALNTAAPALVDSPEEALETSYRQMRATLEGELLDAVKSAPPTFFEELVVDLLVRMGYGGSRPEAARAVGRSGDGGIDGVIDEDRLGLDAIYVQAKRWEATVGRPEIQKFAGALQGQRAKKGIFITTSSFTRDAQEYAQRIENRIILIDGTKLAGLMFDFDVGVSARSSFTVKKLDSDYFEQE
jgi:restriction system protein